MSTTSTKSNFVIQGGNTESDGCTPTEDLVEKKNGNQDDRAAMWRMGKTQELRRDFSGIAIFGFTMILVASWETTLICSTMGLVNGGPAGLIWNYLIAWVAFTFIYMSMSEMASMAPTSGGQYHWISEFAPRQHQKFLSYFVGWLSVLGWQATTAGAAYLTGSLIQALLVLNVPSYVYQYWHGTLLTIAAAGLTVVFNIFLARKLPVIEGILVLIHIFGFFGVLVALWVLRPDTSTRAAFTMFSDGGRWGTLGGSTLVGITSGILPVLGADAAVHMSEEVRNAGKALPRSIMAAVLVNGVAGLLMMITFSICVSAMDMNEILSTDTGFPFVQVMYNVAGSAGGATVLVVCPVIFAWASTLTLVATSSRQLYAFGRDNALPFSPWISRVSSREVPVNGILLTFTLTSLLSLINLGSSVVLNSLTSLSTCALLSAYITCIGCVIYRRVANLPLLPSSFSLGKYGLAINCISMTFLVIFLILAFFPEYKNPTAEEMNWNILIYGSVSIFSLLYYFFFGRHVYAGPVAYVRKLD